MLEITNLVTPSPVDWEVTIKGMRLPFKSGDKYDSIICDNILMEKEACYNGCPYVDHWEGESPYSIPICGIENEDEKVFILGENDKSRLLNLCCAGDPSHRKILRQLPVKCFITAPEYWWRQMDQYKVGTVTNSTSQMHTLTKKELEINDFSLPEDGSFSFKGSFQMLLNTINGLINAYNETKDKEYWLEALALIPQSFNYTRCWSGNYENLITIINQRSGHRLGEWHTFCEFMLDNVPYLKEINEAVNG